MNLTYVFATPVRQKLFLNEGWEFTSNSTLDYNAFLSTSHHAHWEEIDLPLIQGFRQPDHFGWYKKIFSLDDYFLLESKGKSIKLTFEDVRHLAKVYLNGQLVGEHFGGYLPFSLEVGHLLKAGQNDIIVGVQDWTSAVKADGNEDKRGAGNSKDKNNRDGAEGIPAGAYAVPRYMGFPTPGTIIAPIGNHEKAGICGEVYLETIPYLYIDEVNIEPKVEQRKIRFDVGLNYMREQMGDPNSEVNKAPNHGSLSLVFWVKELGVTKRNGLNRNSRNETKEVASLSGIIGESPYRKIGLISIAEMESTTDGKRGSAYDSNEFTCGGFTFDADFTEGKQWDPEHPYLYLLKVCLQRGDAEKEVLDEVEVCFGYRQFNIKGPYFFFNGERINLRQANIVYESKLTADLLRERIQNLKEAHFNLIRFHGEPVPPWMLDICDEEGMLVAVESAIYGSYVGRYDTSFNSEFWLNAENHWHGLIKRDRNHPSVVIWSIENESVEYDVGHEGEVRFMELGMIVKRLDPARPIVYEGGMDCFGVGDIINLHYAHEFPFWNCLPNDAWWIEQESGEKREDVKVNGSTGNEVCVREEWPGRDWGKDGPYLDSLWRWMPDYRFRWKRDKPLYLGEELDIPSMTPDPYTILLGDEAYENWQTCRNEAKAMVWQYYLEAYRRADVGGISPWVLNGGEAKDNLLYLACQECFKPVTIFIKEKNNRFWEGDEVVRTVSVYNDEHGAAKGDTFVMAWQLVADNNIAAKGEHTFHLWPGFRHDLDIRFKIPQIAYEGKKREKWCLRVRVIKNGQVRDEKVWAIWGFRKDTGSRASTIAGNYQISVYDPDGKVAHILSEEGLKYKRIGGYQDIEDNIGSSYTLADISRFTTEDTGDTENLNSVLSVSSVVNKKSVCCTGVGNIIILGRNAFSTMEDRKITVGGSSPWQDHISRFVDNGGIVIVFEQEFYPVWLPDKISLNNLHHSTIAFPGQGDHPVLKGISEEDLRFWGKDNFISRYDINLPCLGNYYSIVNSGGTGGLVYTPLIEVNKGKGSFILCQMLITQKWNIEPIAKLLLRNILEYVIAAAEKNTNGKKKVVEIPNEKLTTNEIGGIPCRSKDVIVFQGKGATWEWFSRQKDELLDFVKKGGKVLLRGINEENIHWVQSVLPIEIRPIERKELPVKVVVDYGQDGEKIRQKRQGKYSASSLYRGEWGRFMKCEANDNEAEAERGLTRIEKKIALYNRDLYWVEPHSEFQYGWANLAPGIADHAIVVTKKGNDFRVIPWTTPGVLVELDYGKGFFLIDQVKWEKEGFNKEKSKRYASSILRYLGVEIIGDSPQNDIMIQVENMSCRTPNQPLIRCRSHDYWTICSENFVCEKVNFLSDGEYEIVVRAKCRLPSYPPLMSLMVDGAITAMQTVSSLGWDYYKFKAWLGEGEHEVGVALLNSVDPYEEKYLYLDWIKIKWLECLSLDR